MTNESVLITLFIAAALAAALGALFWCASNRKNQRRQRELLDYLAGQNEELEKSLAAAARRSAALEICAADHARKIAWLETRVRRPQNARFEHAPEKVELALEKETPAPEKNGIGDRRRRVLRLAELGHDAPAIAARLGMMAGEVELIVKLNRAAV